MLITKEALKTLINGLVAKMQNYRGNWNQSDPTASDYIKNKPFYKETKFAEILPEINFTVDGSIAGISNVIALTAGETYIVNFNGVNYECLAEDGSIVNAPFPSTALGNFAEMGGEDTGEPFVMIALDEAVAAEQRLGIMLIPLDGSTSGTLSISGNIKILKTIDEEYLGLNVKNGSGEGSVIEGSYTTASGYDAHAEGQSTTASGDCSHAEGGYTTASGEASHAEGGDTTASGEASHAEGDGTTAGGNASHAEGDGTTAGGNASHAEGGGTTASGIYQHVQGKYNIEDTTDTYAHIVGNGDYNNRSNAHTLDWNGNAWFKGDVYVGGTGQNSTSAKTLTTSDYVVSMLNRTTSCGSSTTNYSTYMARGEALFSTETTPTYNGQIAWTYE